MFASTFQGHCQCAIKFILFYFLVSAIELRTLGHCQCEEDSCAFYHPGINELPCETALCHLNGKEFSVTYQLCLSLCPMVSAAKLFHPAPSQVTHMLPSCAHLFGSIPVVCATCCLLIQPPDTRLKNPFSCLLGLPLHQMTAEQETFLMLFLALLSTCPQCCPQFLRAQFPTLSGYLLYLIFILFLFLF